MGWVKYKAGQALAHTRYEASWDEQANKYNAIIMSNMLLHDLRLCDSYFLKFHLFSQNTC